jgi:hypothetical protein
MNTCKTCKHWDTSQPEDFGVYHGDSHFPCERNDGTVQIAQAHGAYTSTFDGSHPGLVTGPDFGCIHWEKKDE